MEEKTGSWGIEGPGQSKDERWRGRRDEHARKGGRRRDAKEGSKTMIKENSKKTP